MRAPQLAFRHWYLLSFGAHIVWIRVLGVRSLEVNLSPPPDFVYYVYVLLLMWTPRIPLPPLYGMDQFFWGVTPVLGIQSAVFWQHLDLD